MKTVNIHNIKPPAVCRTCLTVLKEDPLTFLALENKIREKLNYCIPELALDIIPNAVICTTCSMALNLAYDFKSKCLEVEAKVRQYLSLKDRSDEGNEFIQADYKSQYSPDSTCVKLEPETSEINQNRNCLSQIENRYISANNYFVSQTNECSVETELKLLETREIKGENEIKADDVNTATLIEDDREFQFAKALQRLKNNVDNTTVYQAFHQFNLIKTMQILANQGTEININTLGKRFSKTTTDYNEQPGKQQKPPYDHYNCYYCNRSFDRLSLLKTHIISHTGVKPFTCTICGKGCSHKGELNNHIRTHTGEKPFKCNLCEASFSQISNMKIHMRTHTGEKPYKCDYCEKMFSHKCGVKVHMRTHTGERPYKCEVCSKTYTHKKDLDDHMRTHTGEKYRCTICSKEITYKKNLSAHMITHSGKNGGKQAVNKKHNVIHLMYPQRLTY